MVPYAFNNILTSVDNVDHLCYCVLLNPLRVHNPFNEQSYRQLNVQPERSTSLCLEKRCPRVLHSTPDLTSLCPHTRLTCSSSTQISAHHNYIYSPLDAHNTHSLASRLNAHTSEDRA
eukprot:m.17645 g.17645  ORF g.17645 m.17645 type:complete len:118 (+) comp8330_c0_seq1:1672-2025(+)